jgi:single-strand DNA-binding protein
MNKVIFIGRLTKDPELNFAAGTGTAVARFTLAVTRPFKKDETDFINCIAFNKRAEAIAQYLTSSNRKYKNRLI